jgi:hypothetical protein
VEVFYIPPRPIQTSGNPGERKGIMTRKNYVAFARILKDARDDLGSATFHPVDVINRLEDALTTYLRQDNERFDGERFRKASGREGF